MHGVAAWPCPTAAPPRRSARQRSRRRAAVCAAEDDAAAWVSEHAGAGAVRGRAALGSSDWATSVRLDTDSGASFFVKTSSRDADMFTGEAWGLRAMGATATLRVPHVLHSGALPSGRGSFIVMEHLQLRGSADQAVLGRQLALMHAAPPLCSEAASGSFGFPVHNTIGGTPQLNAWSAGSGTAAWLDFFREQRLRPQCAMSGEASLVRLGDALCERLPALFEGIAEVRPAILHGDLWSGNVAAADGAPVVFDPASYYGHAEAEFGMSWCASFGPAFWQAYHDVLPREPGFEKRAKLYKLYHYLNHFNMFGGGYYGTALALLQELTA